MQMHAGRMQIHVYAGARILPHAGHMQMHACLRSKQVAYRRILLACHIHPYFLSAAALAVSANKHTPIGFAKDASKRATIHSNPSNHI